jgi:hypothetical protein
MLVGGSWVEHFELSGVMVVWGSGEIPVGLFDADAATPAGVVFPS